MEIPAGQNPIAHAMARVMLEGFDKHYRIFRECGLKAKGMFEAGDWTGTQLLVRDRIQFYDDRVNEVVERLRDEFEASDLDDEIWQQTKLIYLGLLINHKQPECAETFFNSVCCKILYRTYFHNAFIFFRPGISTEYLESDPPTFRVYYPDDPKMRGSMKQMFLDFGWTQSFVDLDRDITYVREVVRNYFLERGGRPAPQPNLQLQVLHAPFYRNKAAYVVGRVVNGFIAYPFVIPVLRDSQGRLYLDAILLDEESIHVVFSLNRTYFLVDMEVPSSYVEFLRSMMPNKPKSELYTMLGLQKQGKTLFYRDLDYHLHHSRDQFATAPGIRGMVMIVFTMPSFPYVFKVIRDVILPPKQTNRATVQAKYLLVKQHERVGRMSDTLEFSDVALPKSRFAPELLADFRELIPTQIDEEGELIVIKHVYIERRMVPLDLYIDTASEAELEHAIREFGNSIKELACANIFPGDMLWKNFGLTRHRRVVFYDYDEIEYLTDCHFRHIPPPPFPEYEMLGEPWFSVGPKDIFPEEFEPFIIGSPKARELFLKYHADLLTPEYWLHIQEQIREGQFLDFFPYPESLRFCKLFAGEPVETLNAAASEC